MRGGCNRDESKMLCHPWEGTKTMSSGYKAYHYSTGITKDFIRWMSRYVDWEIKVRISYSKHCGKEDGIS
jgi:hypothetical protein